MTSLKTGNRHQGKLIKQLLKAPAKFLAGARDFYVKSMVICDGQMGSYGRGGAIFCPAHCTAVLPRSFSVSSSSNNSSGPDCAELTKPASRRRFEELERRRSKRKRAVGPPGTVPRSFSVGIERIDEDMVCEFGEEVVMVKTRSHGHAIRSI
ncbi:unnamed protein product [Rhodiola kirilowii]